MQIGDVIRKNRKNKNMTQEEMANRLGVTAPAVNKWENGNSLPDIMLLAPIARLLGISLDTLLAFHADLTDEEVKALINELDVRFQQDTFEEAFQWGKKQLESYPNCERLTLWMTQIFDAQRCIKNIPNSADYDDYICTCYACVLDSRDEDVRTSAADSLFNYYLRNDQYDKAEEYLAYFSKQNPERKRKQAVICSRTDRVNEAYKSYEELLFSGYQLMSLVLHSIYMLAMQEKKNEKAHVFVDKQSLLAQVFEMGEYNEIFWNLDLAAAEKDVDATITTMEKMLANVDKMCTFRESVLYEHMVFKDVSQEFHANVKKGQLENFRDEETFDYLKGNRRWAELVGDKSN